MLGLANKSSNATIVYVKVNMAGRTITAPIDICVSVTAKSLVHCIKHPAKFSTDTLNATKIAKSPIHRALKIAYSCARTVDAVRCYALSPAVFFYIPKDIEKRLAAAISVYRYTVKSVFPLNIVRSTLLKISKVL